jgi:tetratricopeptide (TPR) repeat protein
LAVANFRLLYLEWRKEDEEARALADQAIRRLSGSDTAHSIYHLYAQALLGEYEEAYRRAEALIDSTASPTVYVLGSGVMGMSLMLRGRFGGMRDILRAGRELGEKNGEDAWMYILGEAWLRTLCFDFEGARRVGEITMRSDAEQHAIWLRAVSWIASGYAELYRGNYDEALRFFSNVRDPEMTPKFFLHWRWRLHALVGTVDVRLHAGDIAHARSQSDELLTSALSAASPDMRALAWEMKSRVASAGKDIDAARVCIGNALEILDRFDIPVAGWQVHRTAWDLHAGEGNHARAGEHRARAKELIMRIADSFAAGEPLRESLLSAPPVRRVLAGGAERPALVAPA